MGYFNELIGRYNRLMEDIEENPPSVDGYRTLAEMCCVSKKFFGWDMLMGADQPENLDEMIEQLNEDDIEAFVSTNASSIEVLALYIYDVASWGERLRRFK